LRTSKTYELKDVKAINEGNIMSLDPFFEIEFRNKNGSIDKVDFMPKVSEQLTFMFTKKIYWAICTTSKRKSCAARARLGD
jgi:hypothetical protein